jgi:hypothetical protein
MALEDGHFGAPKLMLEFKFETGNGPCDEASLTLEIF